MNLTKLVLDLFAIAASALILVIALLFFYSVSVDGFGAFDKVVSDSTFTLMWASTVLGLLAGKYR